MQLFQPELGRRTCLSSSGPWIRWWNSLREPSQESSFRRPSASAGNRGRHRARHGRSQLHDTFATWRRRVPKAQRGLAAWPLIRGGSPLMLVASPVTRLASRSYLGSYGDGGEITRAKGNCRYAMCQNSCSSCPVNAQSPRSSWSLKKSPHPIALDLNLRHLLDYTRENPSGLAVRPCVSITRAVSLRTET